MRQSKWSQLCWLFHKFHMDVPQMLHFGHSFTSSWQLLTMVLLFFLVFYFSSPLRMFLLPLLLVNHDGSDIRGKRVGLVSVVHFEMAVFIRRMDHCWLLFRVRTTVCFSICSCGWWFKEVAVVLVNSRHPSSFRGAIWPVTIVEGHCETF